MSALQSPVEGSLDEERLPWTCSTPPSVTSSLRQSVERALDDTAAKLAEGGELAAADERCGYRDGGAETTTHTSKQQRQHCGAGKHNRPDCGPAVLLCAQPPVLGKVSCPSRYVVGQLTMN